MMMNMMMMMMMMNLIVFHGNDSLLQCKICMTDEATEALNKPDQVLKREGSFRLSK